jgi:hypothetical protein
MLFPYRYTSTYLDLHGLTSYQALSIVREAVHTWWDTRTCASALPHTPFSVTSTDPLPLHRHPSLPVLRHHHRSRSSLCRREGRPRSCGLQDAQGRRVEDLQRDAGADYCIGSRCGILDLRNAFADWIVSLCMRCSSEMTPHRETEARKQMTQTPSRRGLPSSSSMRRPLSRFVRPRYQLWYIMPFFKAQRRQRRYPLRPSDCLPSLPLAG